MDDRILTQTGDDGRVVDLVRDGFAGGAQRIVESALAGETDDRALVLIWRE